MSWEKAGQVQTKDKTYPFRFFSVRWARSFQCLAGLCGLCCLVELPSDVPRKHSDLLDKSICGFYDSRQKSCSRYSKRPFGCRIYPFFLGVEDGVIYLSTMLGCPATNHETEIEENTITRMLSDPEVYTGVIWLDQNYMRARQDSRLWMNAENICHALSSNIMEFFRRKSEFPLMSEFKDVALTAVDDLLHIPESQRKHFAIPQMHNLVRAIARSYLATRFDSTKIYTMQVKGSKILMKCLDPIKGTAGRIRCKIPAKSLCLGIERKAKEMLEDYMALMLQRPFLSLAASAVLLYPTCVPFLYTDNLVGSVVNLEVGASIIAERDHLTTIDADSMREIISFSEISLISQFNRPDKSAWSPGSLTYTSGTR